MTTAVCVVNPHSGGGRTGARWPAIERALTDAGLTVDARFTAAPGDGTTLAAAALHAGADLVVAVGGDGTVHEVANGFFRGRDPIRPDARLAVIPAGTGSDFIKSHGIPADPIAAARRLATGTPRAIDLAWVGFRGLDGAEAHRWSINIASVGMPAAVLTRMATLPGWMHGQARYIAGSLLAMADMRPFPVAWRVDGSDLPPGRAHFVAVGNARYFGAGMYVMPQAIPDDGLLDAVMLEDRPVWELLPNFPRLYTGTHLDSGLFAVTRGRVITIDADAPVEIDGEIAGRGPIVVTVVPGALNLLA